MNSIKLKAYAKINLTLDVVGKKDNGYHLLETVMQSVKLCDDIFIKKIKSDKIKLKCNLPWLPTDKKNLVFAVSEFMREKFSIDEGLFIDIYKRIPVGAGLGGGSADCACTVFGINKLFNLNLSFPEMIEICKKFGTDIPFCLVRGTAFAEGLGDEFTILPPAPNFYTVLAKPPVSVSTAHVYKNLVWNKVNLHPDTKEFIKAIKEGDKEKIPKGLVNVLETVTLAEQPSSEKLKRRLLELGAEGALLSGSGPTVYGLFTDLKLALNAKNILKKETGFREIYMTEFYRNRSGEKIYGQRF